MSSIFLSYSRKNEAFAKRIAHDLKSSNIKIWFDQTDIPKGSLWDNEIEKALKNCDTVIFIISKDSVKSNHVLDEISFALEESKKIIPLILNDCDIPFRLRRIQNIDFTQNYEDGMVELSNTLNINLLTKKNKFAQLQNFKKTNFFWRLYYQFLLF